MVFPSSSVYSDHPNWHQIQQPNLQLDYGGGNFQLESPPLQSEAAVSGGSNRPGSMVDRARQAKLPQPEAGLKCPRCESTNTKFCYFNNYNLSQPRHFCKTCRRYWTRGGALRSVPVGGGCRRNKRPKKGSNTKPKSGPENQTGNNPTSSPSHLVNPQTTPQFPFLGALQNLVQSNGGVGGGSMGISRFQPQMAGEGGGSGPSGQTLAFQMGFPFLNGLDQPTNNFFPYQSEGVIDRSRHFMGIMENNQNWGGPSANTWPEVSGQNSSLTSTSHLQ